MGILIWPPVEPMTSDSDCTGYSTAFQVSNPTSTLLPEYLCISCRSIIVCLHLTWNNEYSLTNGFEFPLIPLYLIKNAYPAAVGLGKFGSNTCAFGGSESNFDPQIDRFAHQYSPSSHQIKVLSLDSSNSTLSLSKSNIVQLQYPKLFPIVENIDGQTHVFDSTPEGPHSESLYLLKPDCVSVSHEVFNPDCGTWSQIPTPKDLGHIVYHVVVGHRIYAVSDRAYLVFDSNAGIWDEPIRFKECPDTPRNMVWEILSSGAARCVQGLTVGDSKDPLYVLVAVVPQLGYCDEAPQVKALLVNSTGHIVCFQYIHDFFKGDAIPCSFHAARIINVDKEGNTLCSIVNAYGYDNNKESRSFYFINAFTLDVVSEAVEQVIRGNGRDDWKVKQLEFVHLHVRARCIYVSKDEIGNVLANPNSFQACFL